MVEDKRRWRVKFSDYGNKGVQLSLIHIFHDYFFAKSIDKVRNGGVIAFITSSGTMDKKDESVRRYLAARTEFIGAIRLPNDTFKGCLLYTSKPKGSKEKL